MRMRTCVCTCSAPEQPAPEAESRNMSKYSLHDVADDAILTRLDSLDTRDWDTSAELLAHLAEVDGRKLYVPLGFPCMRDYCVHGRLLRRRGEEEDSGGPCGSSVPGHLRDGGGRGAPPLWGVG